MLISADDRTGAAEVAGAVADLTQRSVRVVTSNSATPGGDHQHCVVDLNSRHDSPMGARERIGPWAGSIGAHKMDSTLRGNWSDEVAGLVAAERRVLVVPALPSMGRTCHEGVVYDHGRPVHEGPAGSDVRRRVTTSSTTELLAAAGLGNVAVLASADDVVDWNAGDERCAVADVADDEALSAVVQAWSATNSARESSVVVGTSQVIAAAVVATDEVRSGEPPTPPARRTLRETVTGPALVVCGSLHPMARQQVAHAERNGVGVSSVADDYAVKALDAGDPLILTTEIPVGPVESPVAIAAASGLARDAATLIDSANPGVVLIIGGDTASAVIGERDYVVEGTVGPGMPIGMVDGVDVAVITRAGGFGTVESIDRLVRYQLRR